MAALTVTELKEILEELESEGHGEKKVYFTYNFGDYWRTTVAAEVEYADPGQVANSDYHQMMKVLEEDDEHPISDRDKQNMQEAILLS